MEKIFDLKDRIAIVTGGSRGIGKATAELLSHYGAKIVIADILEEESVNTANEITKKGGEAIAIKTDVSNKKDIENLIDATIKKFGRVDILVNNAGIYKAAPTEEVSEEEWARVLDINLKGYFLCAQVVGREMIKQKYGRIVNISSIAGLSGFSNSAAYCASKAAIILLTKTLAIDWAKYNIRVNAICPGVIKTAMTDPLLKDTGFQEMIKQRVPLSREGKPEEIAAGVLFLVSDASSYMTGHAMIIDGGWTAGI